MKSTLRPLLPLTALLLLPTTLPAGVKEVAPPVLEEPREVYLSKVSVEGSYTWEGDLEREGSGARFHAVDVWYSRVTFDQSIPLGGAGETGWYAKVGARYSYMGIGETDAPLPETLQSIAVPLGLEYRSPSGVPLPKATLSISPGFFFSEEISGNDFDIPTYAFYGFDLNEDLRVYVGAFGGLMNKYGVLPGGGVAWRFHRGGLLSLSFPQGGIYIFPNKDWEIFAGGEWFSHTHRVDREEEFPGALKDGLLDYREIRLALGVKYKPTPSLSVGIQGGYTLDREFDYERAGYTLEQDNAPYAKATVELRF